MITIHEVGPRDGLQSYPVKLGIGQRVELIESLADSGIQNIEVGAFVHPKKVPNMEDSIIVYEKVAHLPCNLSVLVPNEYGMQMSRNVGVEFVNVFFSHSEEFNRRNLGCGLEDIVEKYRRMLSGFPKENVKVYLSCIFGCPFTGFPSEEEILRVVDYADEIGGLIVLCDTVGVATEKAIEDMLKLLKGYDVSLHLHGNDLIPKVEVAYYSGVKNFDASINGLGGCPFVPNIHGNLPTEDLVDWANRNGVSTGIDLEKLNMVNIGGELVCHG
jgi:hydroxymethylglutaryl-CoA lyase